jgi:hypothetical protein
MIVKNVDWGKPEKKPLTKERIEIICLEETIKQLPWIQHRMREITARMQELSDMRQAGQDGGLISMQKFFDDNDAEYSILAEEYNYAMKAKREMTERAGREWAEYIHMSAIHDFSDRMKENNS